MIEFRNVSVTYRGGIAALEDVDLSVQRGEFVFVVGPTGAGKSTLLKLLYGGERPTGGQLLVNGVDLAHIRAHDLPFFRRKIGVVFQDYGLLPDKTVYENVAFALRVTGAGRAAVRRQVPRVLDMVSMAHRPDAFPGQLSGGEQQRIAIARALVNDPPLLLADEPTGNLDPDTSNGIVDLIHHINVCGTTILVATHDTQIVDRLRRRVLAFEKGRLVRDEREGGYARDDTHILGGAR
jgi:cell division transport system ATP-binding protein